MIENKTVDFKKGPTQQEIKSKKLTGHVKSQLGELSLTILDLNTELEMKQIEIGQLKEQIKMLTIDSQDPKVKNII
jgi:hypothetical protein